jgi:predicted HTH domain antitoxin
MRNTGQLENTVTLRVPQSVQAMLNRTPEELGRDPRLYSALMLFQVGKLSAGAAAELAGVPKVIFLDLCGQYNIAVSQITPEELRDEIG